MIKGKRGKRKMDKEATKKTAANLGMLAAVSQWYALRGKLKARYRISEGAEQNHSNSNCFSILIRPLSTARITMDSDPSGS